MLEFQTQRASEAKLAALLGELLEGEGAGGADGGAAGDVPAELVEMRDMARLLRAASQSAPLPEGRLVVRRALLATLPPSGLEWSPARAAWRRTGRWLGLAVAAGMIVAAFGLGAGLLDGIGSPSNPLYGVRHAIDRVRLAFVPGRPQGTRSPSGSTQAGTVEIGELATSGYALTGVAGYPLTYKFIGVTIPSTPGKEVTAQGTFGGLPMTLSLTATAGCPAGTTCGLFDAWVSPLRGTMASGEFGQMRGTFVCSAGECKLTLVSKSGVFTNMSASVLPVKAAGETAGLVGTGFASLGDWVSTVEQAAVRLKSEGLLPVGLTVTDLVRDAATNQSVPKPSPQGMIRRPTPRSSSGAGSGLGVDSSVGVATGSSGPSVVVGTGASGAPSAAGGAGAGSVGTSTSAGATINTSGTGVSGTATGSVSGVTSSGGGMSMGGAVSGGMSGSSVSGGGSVSGGTSSGGGTSAGGTVSGGTSGGSVSGSGSVSGGTSIGGGTSVGGVNVGGVGGLGGGGSSVGGGLGGGGR